MATVVPPIHFPSLTAAHPPLECELHENREEAKLRIHCCIPSTCKYAWYVERTQYN